MNGLPGLVSQRKIKICQWAHDKVDQVDQQKEGERRHVAFSPTDLMLMWQVAGFDKYVPESTDDIVFQEKSGAEKLADEVPELALLVLNSLLATVGAKVSGECRATVKAAVFLIHFSYVSAVAMLIIGA